MFWVLISSIAENAGMYIAEMFEDSWQLLGMAEQGMMPKFLPSDTPPSIHPSTRCCCPTC